MEAEHDEGTSAPDCEARIHGATRHRVLSSTQLAVLGAEAWSPDPSAFTVVSAVYVKGIPDWGSVANAVLTTLSRHDVFTWRLELDEHYRLTATGGHRKDVSPAAVEHVDLSNMTKDHAQITVRARMGHERRRAINLLDPYAYPYTKVTLFRFGRDRELGESGVCVLTTHHVFTDEHSIHLLWNEIFQRAAGRNIVDHYDRRYADWAEASVGFASRQYAEQAAADILGKLSAGPLGTIGTEVRSTLIDGLGSPHWFPIPSPLKLAISRRAKDLGVSVSSVYSAAWITALCERATVPRITVSTPITLRKAADLDVVGCFVGSVPVPGEAIRGEDSSIAIRRWQRSLDFAADRGHANAETVQRALHGVQRFSLTFETRGAVQAVRPISWQVLPPPDSRAKASASLFVSLGGRSNAGDGRLLWRDGVLTDSDAGAIVSDYIRTVARFC
ncbi:condensation domain-containing protein [Kibdelosporangium aridum]|uniref:condensation domain-containing protein n=1 Tax=Kibdelosporangium aridum TaxID=2030 RepID=UPI0035E8DECF